MTQETIWLYTRAHTHARTHKHTTPFVISRVLSIFIYFDLVIILLALHPQEIFLNTEKYSFAEMIIILLFIKMNIEKKSKCPTIGELLCNLHYSHLLEYYVAICL